MKLTRRGGVAMGTALFIALGSQLPQPVRAAEPVDAAGLVEARAFLDEYQAASGSQDTTFYALYSDRALIHAQVSGKDRPVAFQGAAYKAWGRELAQSRRAVPDASEFHESSVERRGSRLVIRAKRYSLARCFWDLNYQVSLEKEGASYRIVDEALTTKPDGLCPAPGAVTATTLRPTPVALIRDPHASDRPDWHPLSQDEIAASALRLAQQTAAKYPAESRVVTAPALVAASAPQAVARPRPVEPQSALWVTPEN